MIRRPPRSTLSSSSAASDVYKRQLLLPPLRLPLPLPLLLLSHPHPTTTTTTSTTTTTTTKHESRKDSALNVIQNPTLAKLGPEMAGRPLMMPRRGRLSPSIVKASHRRCNENVFSGHVCVHFRGLRRLGNTSHTIGAKSGTKTAHKRWAPTVGAHALLYNLVPFSELIIRAQQRDPIGT